MARRPRGRLGRSALRWVGPIIGVLLAYAAVGPGAATAATTWSKNLYVNRAFMYQDPYPTACTAAAAMMMLNTIAYRQTGGDGFIWTPTRIKADAGNQRDMLSILAFARAHDTLRAKTHGSDPHGWRNVLNAFGWGQDAMTDPAKRVYDDRAYRTFDSAVKSAVRAIARRSMPVGILGWAGGHAQVMTGYVVTGADPSVSNDFVVRYVYLSDPLAGNSTVNRRISVAKFRSGPLRTRFQAYREADSPYDDPYTAGTIKSSVVPSRGRSEWYHRWVILRPVAPGGPPVDPTPTPDPTSTQDPTPTPEPTPTQEPTSAPDSTRAPDPTHNADPTPTPEPTPDPTVEPTPDPTVEPTPDPTVEPTPEPAPDAAAAPASEEPADS